MSNDPQTSFLVYMSATGQILRTGMCRQSVVAAQALNAGEAALVVDVIAGDTSHWVNAGLIEQRPGLYAVPATKALAVDEDWVVAGIPDGTEVWIDGSLAGTTDATGLTLRFPMAAVWQIRLVPRFPWKPSDCEVTVT